MLNSTNSQENTINDSNMAENVSSQESSQDYLQSLRKYRDEIKREVQMNSSNIKSRMLKSNNLQVILGTPDIAKKDACVENAIKICIYNINGNSNEFKLLPGEIMVSEGSLIDLPLNEEAVNQLVHTLNRLSEAKSGENINIKIPIYIFNINNILTNGSKNTVTPK
jgi:hypothetical protein